MSIQLTQSDFDRLAGLLAALPDFRLPEYRLDFLDGIFAGSARRDDILGQINVSGPPRGVAIRVITILTRFGQDEPGQETLGVLINTLLSYIGSGEDADFLRGLFTRYPLEGDPLATRGLGEWRGHESQADVQEKVIGENTLRDIRVLELALDASRAVVRISGEKTGSGFLVGPGLVMTNNHVVGSEPAAQQSMITFNYQLDRQLQPAQSHTTRALPGGFFYTNPDLDFTLFEIEEAPDEAQPLLLARQRLRRDERVNIIQHPGGHYKKVSMQNNFVAFADARDIQYLTTTEPGSSGSPVFNNDFLVVGIHHSGGNLLEPGTNRRYLRNAGSSMMAVLDDLRVNAPEMYEQLQIQ
ncbi:MAG: trypsin-like peptidase domain-containing protein [Candidatus Promineifilaceae bacterium]